MISILGKFSSINVRKVTWTCAELGVNFEREDWGSGFKDVNLPEYLALNPNGLVPVIRDGDFVLWESNTIIRYLCNRDRSALYPGGARARARVDQWIDWQATDLNSAWRYAFQALARNSEQHRDPASIMASVAAWNRNMTILDGQLAATAAYVAGDAFSLADIPIGLSVHRWLNTPMTRPDLPAAAAYYARLWENSRFQAHTTVV